MARKTLPTLAAALSVIATEGHTLESRADTVLAIVKSAGIRDEKSFSAAVREAYKANGWNVRAGKPAAGGNHAGAVPATVKQYVSTVRAAFRLGVPVGRQGTFFKLRQALKAARAAAKPAAAPVNPALVGLRLVKSGELNGAPFHDLTVIYEQLGKTQQRALVAEVNALVRKFQPAAPQLTLAKAA